MRKFFFLFLIFILFSTFPSLAQKYTISGYIKDSETGEDLIGATIKVEELNKGTATNVYGFYSLTLPPGNYNLTMSYLGYDVKKNKVSLKEDLRLNFELTPTAISTGEIVVTGEKEDENVQSTEMGTIDLSMEKVKKLPALLGEVDVLKTLQLLPGVQSAGEGNSGFYVRGGGPDQNLILLDEAVVYNTGHLFGFFSVFNPDAIKNTTLIKGGMPSEYGGRLSSVVDISMKDGNNKSFHGEGGIGLISSRLTLEGPLVKDRSSFMVSARRTYVDVLIKPFIKNTDFDGNGYYFYDVNAKLNYRFSDKDRVFFSGYFGRDVFSYNSSDGDFGVDIPWGNTTATLRWNHLFNDKLFMNISTIYNDYEFAIGINQENWNFRLFSGIKDIGVKTDFTWFAGLMHKVKYGLDYTYHTFIPSTATGESEEGTFIDAEDIRKKFAHEAAVYIQDEFDVSDKFKINAGIRFSTFQQTGPYTLYEEENGDLINTVEFAKDEIVEGFYGFEPRLNMRYKLKKDQSMKASYTRTKQYIHLVSNSNTTLPTDIWVPSTKVVMPQVGDQVALGYFRNLKDNSYEVSVEVYYKFLRNQIEYRDGYVPSFNRELERDFVFGNGESYGVELFINKKFGKITGWIGYTLSKTTRLFDDLATTVFPAKYDRRHDLSVVASYELNKRISFSGTFIYGTGTVTTVPERWYIVEGVIRNEYGSRNGYRLMPYHRMDLAMTLNGKETKKFTSSWIFAVYNVYNRKNPYFIYFDNEGDIFQGDFDIKAKKVSLFPIIPSITWNFKF